MENLSALITLVIYACGLVGIGLWAARRAKTQDSFLLGDRNLGPLVAGLAYAASSSSAWVLLGFSGFVYAAGPSALWMVPGILAGYGAVWLWAGKVLQDASRQQGHLTLTDFLAEHTGSASVRYVKMIATGLILICFSFYVAGQFQGAGIAIDGLFKTGFVPAVLTGAAIILAYTFLGGFLAVSVTDTLQGLLMMCVAIVLPIAAMVAAGGLAGISEALAAEPAQWGGVFGGRTPTVAAGFVLGLTATGFGALGQPHLIAWIMATRDKRARQLGACVAIGWGAVVYSGMAVLGLSARVLFGADAPAEGVFFAAADQHLPNVFGGIVAAATLSAIMSTVDSQLLVAGGAVSHDLGLGGQSEKRAVLVSRLVIVFVCCAAIALTFLMPSSIFERILFAWVALGAAFGPIVVARVLGLRPTGGAVIATMLSGFLSAVGFELGWPASGPGGVWKTVAPWILGLVCACLLSLRTDRSGVKTP